jgi:hypothetical protein
MALFRVLLMHVREYISMLYIMSREKMGQGGGNEKGWLYSRGGTGENGEA